MNANLLAPNLQQFRTQVIDYWAWFIDEHEDSLANTGDSFEDSSYTNFVITNDNNDMQ